MRYLPNLPALQEVWIAPPLTEQPHGAIEDLSSLSLVNDDSFHVPPLTASIDRLFDNA
jgi:hypothetical protein